MSNPKHKRRFSDKKMYFRTESEAWDHPKRFNARAEGVRREIVAVYERRFRIRNRDLRFAGIFRETKAA